MSILLQLKTAAISIYGPLFRTALIADATTTETAINELQANVASLQTSGSVPVWSSGGSYIGGSVAYSPISFHNYRNKTGVAGTDPSGDTTNWQLIEFSNQFAQVGSAITVAATLTSAHSGQNIPVGDGAAAFNITLPAPAAGTIYTLQGIGTGVYQVGLTFTGNLHLPDGTAVAAGTWAGMNLSKKGNVLGIVCLDGANWNVIEMQGEWNETRYLDPSLFYKLDALTPAFIKTAAGTISVKAGTVAMAFGTKLKWAVDTAVTMPALTGGVDYAIYVCTDGTIRADASFTAPTSYTVNNSRMIGGFHYGLVAAGTTVAGGSFATTGNGRIWTQGDVDDIAGINKYSIWDLKFRPAAADPRGMVLVGGRTWVDIYLCSTDTATNGTSKSGTNIASHTVLPKIPAAFGGNGTTTYPSLNWWVANELARANKKRLMWEHEFVEAAYGVTENQSIDATASTYPTTQRNAGYTSKYGIEQASGHHCMWGQDSNYYGEAASPAFTYKDVNGNTGAAGSGRGQTATFGTYGLVRVILGGSRTGGASSGSRCSSWSGFPWYSDWYIGLRAACDHLQSV